MIIYRLNRQATSAAVAQFSDRMYAEGGDMHPGFCRVQASHCQGDVRYDSFSRNHHSHV